MNKNEFKRLNFSIRRVINKRTYKKSKISPIFFLLIVVVIAVILISGGKTISKIRSVMGTYDEKPTVIIDPGHGGFDGGAVGVNNIVEKNINLSISQKLADILKVNGFNVIMTREEDISLEDSGLKTVRERKKSDMKKRLDIIKENPNAIFVSIHQNKFEKQSPKDTQVFYSKNNIGSEQLASKIQDNFINILQPDNKRAIKQSGKELYLLHNAEIPAVLVECGFLSNYEDAFKLLNSDYQDQVAFVIYKSISEFITNDVV